MPASMIHFKQLDGSLREKLDGLAVGMASLEAGLNDRLDVIEAKIDALTLTIDEIQKAVCTQPLRVIDESTGEPVVLSSDFMDKSNGDEYQVANFVEDGTGKEYGVTTDLAS